MDSSVRVEAIENLGKWNTEMTKFTEFVLYSGFTRERGKSVIWKPQPFRYCPHMASGFIISTTKDFSNN